MSAQLQGADAGCGPGSRDLSVGAVAAAPRDRVGPDAIGRPPALGYAPPAVSPPLRPVDTRATKIRVSSMVLTWSRLLGLSVAVVAHASDLPLAKLEAGAVLTYEETLQLWGGLDRLTEDPICLVKEAASSFDQDFHRAFWTAHEAASGATLKTVAEEMGLSGRSLQRKLARVPPLDRSTTSIEVASSK